MSAQHLEIIFLKIYLGYELYFQRILNYYLSGREARVTANLERMDRQMQQMEAKNKAKVERIAQEQEKRRKILEDVSWDGFSKRSLYRSLRSDFCLQLRQEYGYDIDPNQPQFAQRLEEKEKEYTKLEREERKAKGRDSISLSFNYCY